MMGLKRSLQTIQEECEILRDASCLLLTASKKHDSIEANNGAGTLLSRFK